VSVYTDLIRQHIAYDPDAGTLTWKEDSELGRKGESAIVTIRKDSGMYAERVVMGCEVYEAIDVAWFMAKGEWPVKKVWTLGPPEFYASNLFQTTFGPCLKTDFDMTVPRDVLKQVYRALPDGELRRAVVQAFLRNEGVERCP